MGVMEPDSQVSPFLPLLKICYNRVDEREESEHSH